MRHRHNNSAIPHPARFVAPRRSTVAKLISRWRDGGESHRVDGPNAQRLLCPIEYHLVLQQEALFDAALVVLIAESCLGETESPR